MRYTWYELRPQQHRVQFPQVDCTKAVAALMGHGGGAGAELQVIHHCFKGALPPSSLGYGYLGWDKLLTAPGTNGLLSARTLSADKEAGAKC